MRAGPDLMVGDGVKRWPRRAGGSVRAVALVVRTPVPGGRRGGRWLGNVASSRVTWPASSGGDGR